MSEEVTTLSAHGRSILKARCDSLKDEVEVQRGYVATHAQRLATAERNLAEAERLLAEISKDLEALT